CRGYNGAGGFASTPGDLRRPIDQVDDHIGHIGERQDRVARPIQACHAGAIELQLFDQGAADRLYDTALDLIANTIRVDDLTAIMDNRGALDAGFAALAINLDIDNDANIGARELVMNIAQTAPSYDVATAPTIADLVRLPFRQLTQPSQELGAARITDMLETELQRVRPGRCNDLVEERLIGERVLHATWRTDPRWAQRCARQAVAYCVSVRKVVRNRRVLENASGLQVLAMRQTGELGRQEPYRSRSPDGNVKIAFPRDEFVARIESGL